MSLADHPTVKAYRDGKINLPDPPAVLESAKLKEMALNAGADDAGLVDLSRESLADYRQDLLDAMPDTRSIMALVFRVNQNQGLTQIDDGFCKVLPVLNNPGLGIFFE